MFEVRLHGLTGQGVLATAELLAIAASLEGRHAQALPGFGATRAVGEVVAFCRIDDHEISTQDPVTRPDAMIVDALPDRWSALDGLRDDGYLLVNSGHRMDNLPFVLPPERMIAVPATEIARKLTGRPAPTAALLGGFAALTGVVLLDSVLTAVRQWFRGPAGKAHTVAAATTYDIFRTELADLTGPEIAL